MNVKNLLIALLLSFFLWGCGPKQIEVQTVPVEKTPLEIKEPNPLKPKKVQWYVVTPENVEEVFKELQEKQISIVLFGLTDDGYENLSMNMAEIRKYIITQRAILKQYKDYYEPQK